MSATPTPHTHATPPWPSHPDRDEAINELHARPSMSIAPCDRVIYAGFSCDDGAIDEVISKLGSSTSPEGARYHLFQIPSGQAKLEIHTEFTSLTLLVRNDEAKQDLVEIVGSYLPVERIKLVALAEMIILSDSNTFDESLPEGQRLYGGTVRGGISVRSTLSPNQYGAISYFVCTPQNSPEEIGRRVQRLMEMETYKTMSLLGLPAARRMSTRLKAAEMRLKDVIAAMDKEGHQNEEGLFDTLLELSQECTAMQSETRFRFSASRAYFELVKQRLDSLEEESADGFQTITRFVRSRLDPAIATIESTAARQTTLMEDLASALSLLRTRIDLRLNKDNQALLKSMNARHRQQVLIAQTVEGLSTVAITYYSIGLLTYLVKGLDHWLPLNLAPKTVIAASIPVVLLLTWLMLRRLHVRWKKDTP